MRTSINLDTRPLRQQSAREAFVFEIMLLVVAVGISYLLYRMGAYKMVVLNLYYLPTVLAGYYLGRTNAGVLALFSVLAATIAVMLEASGFAAFATPVMIGLALTVWGACLGLTAILLGTLCDERARTVEDLHAAYVGVVEVLAKYLQSADPHAKARATRIAALCEKVGLHLKLSHRELDDIRVAALLHDLGNIEITTRLITKAMDTLEAHPQSARRHTFSGRDLVHSLGSVLNSALPLLVDQDEAARDLLLSEEDGTGKEVPVGAKIIRTVRDYDAHVHGLAGGPPLSPAEALKEMREDVASCYDETVLAALEQVIRRAPSTETTAPALART